MFDPPPASPQPDLYDPSARPTNGAQQHANAANQALLAEMLRHLAYLQPITSADELGYFLHGIERRTLDRGQRIYSQGEKVDRIYLVVSGQVDELRARPVAAIDDGRDPSQRPALPDEYLLRRAGPPTLLGLFDLVNGKPHSSSARTAVECELIVIEAAQINRLLYRFPDLRASMLPAARIDRMRTMPLLAGADNVAISYVADAAEVRTFIAGDTIYSAGETADRIFLIDQGQVRLDFVDRNNPHALWMGNGGDMGYGTRPVTANRLPYELDHNAVAVSVVRLLVVPRQTFVAATGIMPEVEGTRLRTLRATTLENTGIFGAWLPADRTRLLGFVSHYYLPASHLMTQQGDVADSLWVLLPGGHATVHTVSEAGVALPDVQMEGPGFFNEEALRTQTPAASTLESGPNSAWLRLHWQDFKAFLEQAGRTEMATQLHLSNQAKPVTDEVPQRRFAWLADNERIRIEVRRHWIVALARIAPAALITVLFGWLLVLVIGWGVTSALAWTGVAALALMTIAAWFWGIVDYTNDYLIVTNLRVVRQEKVVLLSQKLQAAPLEKIQDVNFKQDAWGFYFGFADLEVQTPGPGGNIRFDRVADFAKVTKEIENERDARRRHYQATGKKLIYNVLENRFGGVVVLPSRVLGLALNPLTTGAAAPAGFAWLAHLNNALRRTPVTGSVQASVPGAAPVSPAAPTSLSDAPPLPMADERQVWHKHWIVLVRVAILPLLGLIAGSSLGLFFYLRNMGGALVAVSIFFALAAAALLWWNIADWANDVYILDKDQLIDIERKPLGLENKQRTAGMRQIVDLRLEVPSPLHYLLNFGNVFVQTAAQDGEFTFLNVRNPAGVMETIRRRLDQSRVDEERQAAKQRAQEFPDWLEVYSRLEKRRSDLENDEDGRGRP